MSYVSRIRIPLFITLLPLLFLGAGPSPTVESSVFRTDNHLLISEAVVTPTAEEFIEIANPTGTAITLDDYYLSDDEDYALLPGAFGGGPAPGIAASDFIVQFPLGTSIPAGGVLVVAFDGAGFLLAFGSAADFEIFGTDAGTPDMIPTDVGASAGLTNSGENAVLFVWDGASDLVSDVDMVNIGTPSLTNDIGDKTGVTVDGPDADAIASMYLTDLSTMPQQTSDPGFGVSTKRILLEAGSETTGGGNGITGDDETSESITTTWDSPPFSAPDPGVAAIFPPIPEIVITEIMQNPDEVFDSVGEWFEVFNPTASAIDIEGWTIKDDGSNTHTISNGGPLTVPAGGFLVLGNNDNSLTNGGVTVDYEYSSFTLGNTDDEVILIDDLANEIDRVEYDGGPIFPDPTGASMALIAPALDNNVGANWCTASTTFGDGDFGTPGATNDCPPPTVDEVVITEIIQNPSAVSDANGEWFEVFNPTASAIDIDGWTIRDDGSDSHAISNGGPLLVPAGGFLVLARNDNSLTNGGVTVDYEYSSFFLANGDDEVILVDDFANEIDRVEYDGGPIFPDPNGASMSLIAAALDNNAGFNWCTATTSFGDGDLGTPGAANDCPPPEVVIMEIIQNPAAVSDGNGEWFEIFNPTASAIDIDGWTIKDDDFDSHLIDNGGPLVIAASGFLVLARNDNSLTNGGVTVDYEYSSFFLANGADEVVLLDTDLNEIDRVNYDGGPSFPDPNGASMSLIAASLDNNVGANWCTAITPFGDGDKGTPGTFNDCALEIFEIQTAGATSPFDGDFVTTNDNVVTAVGTNGFFMQTPTARTDADITTSDGIFVFTSSAPTVAVGDLVDVTGEIDEFFAFTEFTGSPAVSFISAGNPLPPVVTFSASVPAPSMPQLPPELERYEGMLVEVSGGLATGPTDRFGDFAVVAGPTRAFRESGIEFPGIPPFPLWDGNQEVFEVRATGLGPAIPTPDVPVGATVSATGPLAFRFGDYQIWPTALSVSGTITPDPVRERGHGEVTIGSQNMERLFSSDGDFADRLIKFSKLIREVLRAPDILAVQEVGDLATLQSLADEIETDDPTITYTAFLEEGNDVGGIDVGFLVRGTVKNIMITQLGKTETFIDPTDLSVDVLHDRPPLLLEGDFDLGGLLTPIAVMGVHNRSLNNIDDPFDGERVRAKRLAQANSIAVKVQALQVADPDVRLVVTGDFNAFQFTDGYVDAVGRIAGNFVDADDLVSDPTDHVNPDLTNQVLSLPAEERYSFIFGGNAQVLDHMLTSEALAPIVSGIEYGRANADAPAGFDDDTGTSLRSSDHDGLVLYLTPHNFVFLAEKKIKIDGETLSEGNIHSNDKIEFGKGKGKGKGSSTHTGDLSAVDKIKVDGGQTIDGDATAPTVEVKAGATVTGTVTEGPVNPVPLPTLSFSAGGADVTVPQGGNQSLTPGSYGKVKVEKNGTLELTSGTYFFEKLELKKEATLSIDLAAGAVEVNVVEKVKLDKQAAVVLVSAGAAGSRLFTVNSLDNKNIELKEDAVFLGTIIAPDAKVKIEKGAFFKGAICAEEIDVKKEVTFVPHGSSVVPPAAMPSVLADEVGEAEVLEVQEVPTEFALAPNYPNPFNPTTTIEFSLPEAVEVSLRVYDVMGREVARLVEGSMGVGNHRVTFDASRLASGIYLYRIQAGRFTEVRRMILVK